MREYSPEDNAVIKKLAAASGREWHISDGRFEAFAPASEADILADAFKQAAIASGGAKESDFSLSFAPVDVGGIGARYDDGVSIENKVARDPFFHAAIARPDFKDTLSRALSNDRQIKEEKKQKAVELLNRSTGYKWTLRQHNPEIYYIETVNDANTTAALYKALNNIQRQVLGEGPIAEQLRKGVEGQGAFFQVDDPRKIYSYKLPDDKNAENNEPRYCLTVPHSLIEYTEFADTLPADLRFQITQALRQVESERSTLPASGVKR